MLSLRSPVANRKAVRPQYARLRLESLEARDCPSVSPMPAPALGPALFGHPSHNASLVGSLNSIKHDLASLTPIQITNISLVNGQLLASGMIGNNPFSNVPVTLSLPSVPPGAAAPSASSTPILDLDLAPIHLDVLGLTVDTSAICLDITAHTGPGNLLGNLLSGIANSLNNGLSLSSILNNLGSDLNQLTTGLQGLLNGALSAVTSGGSVTSSSTNILTLSLGPLDLNLLGLNVHLDNCANGPVTVTVGAQSGPGQLLGNLLTDIANLGLPTNLTQRLDQIAGLLVADAALLGL